MSVAELVEFKFIYPSRVSRVGKYFFLVALPVGYVTRRSGPPPREPLEEKKKEEEEEEEVEVYFFFIGV
jgi:hypothetical protein